MNEKVKIVFHIRNKLLVSDMSCCHVPFNISYQIVYGDSWDMAILMS